MSKVKRGPGRPKGSKNKTRKLKKSKPKRGRGRPPKVRRGRPKGSKNRKTIERERQEELKEAGVKVSKYVGECGYCDFSIGSFDLIKKSMYLCPGCGRKARVTKLKMQKIEAEKMDKNEFLKDVTGTDYHDMPAMNNIKGSTFIEHDKEDDTGE